jgi:CheY-like chemotaxis protein
MVVDGNPTSSRLIEQQVSSWGIHCASFDCPRAAIAALRTEAAAGSPFSVVVLDADLPTNDTLTLAAEIKCDSAIATAQLVMITSLARHGNPADLYQADIEVCLTKPLKQSQLYNCLAKLATRGGDSPLSAAPAMHPAEPRSKSAAGPRPAFPDPRPNTRVLLAEDNAVNQRVALRQLTKLGYNADAVANGCEALEALERIPYDVVLMDCQMPEMDGYAATREIRRREGNTHHTPIIALTANALEGDRDKCLQAGMDDYISKPVNQEDLGALLAYWTQPAVRAAHEALEAAEERSDRVLDHGVLGQLRHLCGDGKTTFLNSVIDQFIADSPNSMALVLGAMARQDSQRVVHEVHALKGGAASLGARRMVALCDLIEAECRDHSAPDRTPDWTPDQAIERVRPLVDSLQEELQRVCRALEAEKAPAPEA